VERIAAMASTSNEVIERAVAAVKSMQQLSEDLSKMAGRFKVQEQAGNGCCSQAPAG